MKRYIILTLALALQLTAAPQFMRNADIGAGLVVQTFGYGGQWRVTEFALPYTTTMPFHKSMSLDITSVPAFGLSSNAGSIVGVTNTKVRLSYVMKDLAIFTLGAKVPTGGNEYSESQLETMGQLSRKAFGFPVSDFMHSLDINATGSGGYAFPDLGPGDLVLGLGVGYLYKGSYAPRENVSYDPGDQLTVSLATEYTFLALGRKNRALLDIGYTDYGADKQDDTEVFELGSKKNWALSLSSSVSPEIPVSVKIANYWANNAGRVVSGKLQDPGTASVNQDLYLIMTAGLPFMQKYTPYAQLSEVFMGKDDNNINNGFVQGIGGGGIYKLNDRMYIDGSLNLFLGSLDDGNFINGIDLSAKLKYRM